MAASQGDIREAFVSQDIYNDLHDLKGFRHVFNHGYAINLKEHRVIESLERLDKVLPLFIDAIHALDKDLCNRSDPEDLPSNE